MKSEHTKETFTYVMEGPGEEERLNFKDNTESTLQQLRMTGMDQFVAPPHVLDAGTGVGVVAKQMAHLLTTTYEGKGKLTLLDGDTHRLNVAAQYLEAWPNLDKECIECNLGNIPLEDNTIDYIFCRFVFEYLEDQQGVFAELSRILKPGGKLVLGDLDHNSLNHYPIEDSLQARIDELSKTLEQHKLLDFYAGRKLYSYFYNAHYNDIKVHIIPHHLFYGDLKPADYENWQIKLDRLARLQQAGELPLSFDLAAFKDEFLTFLLTPGRFSYTPLIIVEGRKP